MKVGNRIGESIYLEGNVVFQTVNPKTNELSSDVFYQATDFEIDKSIDLAVSSFEKYRMVSGTDKATFFKEIIRLINDKKLDLIEVYCRESGLDEERANVELNRTINQILNFSKLVENDDWRICEIDSSENEKKSSRTDIRKGLFPLGPVVVFGASNFPFAYSTIGGDSISALAAGCSVIVKSHAFHAGTSDLMASIVIQAAKNTKMPVGIFSHLNAKDYTVGEKLVLDERIKAVGFTGSIKGGKAILALNQKRKESIPIFAEMGSLNPVIISPLFSKEELSNCADRLANSITNNAGQFCTKPGLIFIIESENSSFFIEELTSKVLQKDFQCMLHTTIFENYEKLISERQNLIELKQNAVEEVKINFVRPSIGICDSTGFLNNENLKDEVFGPFSLIVKCESIEDLKKCLLSLEGQLTGTILSNEGEFYFDSEIVYLLQNKVGRLIFNGVPTGVEIVASMQHGGPFPSSSDSRFTAVGIDAIKRFVRPIAFQNHPSFLLPDFLK